MVSPTWLIVSALCRQTDRMKQSLVLSPGVWAVARIFRGARIETLTCKLGSFAMREYLSDESQTFYFSLTVPA